MVAYHLTGRWLPGSVETRFVPSTRIDTETSRCSIERAWERVNADPKVHVFDGPMCRLEGFGSLPAPPDKPSRLRLELSMTTYRVFLGTNLHGPRDLPTETLASPVGVSPALQTCDGFLLFGRRNQRVAYYPHRLHPFSGALEPPPNGGNVDIFEECRRELAEELNLAASEIPQVELMGIVEDARIRYPELILHARTNLSREDVTARLNAAEHDGLVAVPAEPACIEVALSDAAYTPVGRAALTLFAHQCLGLRVLPGDD